MTNGLLAQPGYQMQQYMLVIQPHEELQTRIANIKNEFAQTYTAQLAIKGKPSITVARFSQLALMEDRLKNRLNSIARGLPAFKLHLQDFGSYPTHTIYITIATQSPLQMVTKHLKTARPLLTTKQQKPHFIDNFIMPIARQLLPCQYDNGWKEYSQKHFTSSFVVNNMVLLRRAEGTAPFHPIASFGFLNMPVVTKQGVLF